MKPTIETDDGADSATVYSDEYGDRLRVVTYGDDEPLFRLVQGPNSPYGNVILTRKQSKHLRRLLKADHRDYKAYKADLDR